jgi:trehalose 2-sulfotransferase
MLSATNVAGAPNSYFRRADIWADRWGVPHPNGIEVAEFDRAYLSAMLREGRAGTGVFALRIMWPSMPDALRRLRRIHPSSGNDLAQLTSAFGPILFIHLSREDKVAQAVSLVRAEQSGLWHLNADGSVLEGGASPLQQPVYNEERIQTLVSELEADDVCWRRFFLDHRIEPVEFTYEQLVAGPQECLLALFDALGQPVDDVRQISIPTAKMSDSISEQWISTFKRRSSPLHQ